MLPMPPMPDMRGAVFAMLLDGTFTVARAAF